MDGDTIVLEYIQVMEEHTVKFYRDMEIERTLEIEGSPEELMQRLSKYVVAPPKWYEFVSPVKEEDRPYVGFLNGLQFEITKKWNINIKGKIERCDSNASISILSLVLKDSSRVDTRYPEYWAGGKNTAIIWFIGLSLGFPALLIGLGINPLKLIALIDILLMIYIGYVIFKTNKECEKKLTDRVENEISFIYTILGAKSGKYVCTDK